MTSPLVRVFLLIGIIVGLSMQAAASASTPCNAMLPVQTGAMRHMIDCTTVAAMTKSKFPTKGSPSDCMSMRGCMVGIASEIPTTHLACPELLIETAMWDPAPPLTGRNIAPDPYPPSSLG